MGFNLLIFIINEISNIQKVVRNNFVCYVVTVLHCVFVLLFCFVSNLTELVSYLLDPARTPALGTGSVVDHCPTYTGFSLAPTSPRGEGQCGYHTQH